ncbi:DNA starvation/stationary phase protection protein [Fusobacterium simiae]|uniref:DNA starvation/stationary phase protection protein n=1 Tax=Fusobacterium simiae TaxID=855 RepID=A0ABT4DEP3_FUSSI|nr:MULTISPECIES: DNA starvation/stationary phase protection protein [Fusobacterium]MCY7007076.1 DNA starvation/stationary phase protection protein [Fusobacterium simiae]MDC7955688.1 DNA starvation/stationary phase protection protein [Fusobacterium simiae]
MKNKENLDRYLSNLAVLVTKTHNLHWNVVGQRFMAVHEFTDKLYNYYFEKFDEVAEEFKMKGQYPLAKLSDYLKHATVKEIDVKDFTIPEVIDSVKADMELMLADAKKIREIAVAEDDFTISNLMEDHVAYYVKQLWFLNAMSK